MADNRSTGSYVVLDTMPLVSIAQRQQEQNRKNNAEKAARSATGSAKLNESFDKLNRKVWDRDNEHLNNLIQDTENWMVDTYTKGGETAIYDNPELKREFKSRIAHINNFSQMSRNQQQIGNEQLKLRSGDPYELDYESAVNFDQWLNLPPEQRVLQPVPMIDKRLTTLSEAVDKYGKQHLEGLLQPFEYAGAVEDETGEFTTYEGKRLDQNRLNSLVNSYNTNPNSVIFRTADTEAREDFDYEMTSPTILDNQGNEIPNPAFQEELNKAREIKIKEEILRQADQAYTKSGRRFTPGAAKKAEEQVEIVEVSPAEAEYTTEDIPQVFKESKNLAATGTDETGKQYFKLKVPLYSYEGTVYTKANLPKGVKPDDTNEIPINSWVDKDHNVLPDDAGITETKIRKTKPATRKVNVTKPGEIKTLNVKEYYNDAGELVKTKEGTAVEGTMIGHIEVEGKEITKIKTKKGEIVQIPTTDDVRKIFKDEYSKIDSSSGVSYKKETTKKSSGINWN